MATPPGVPWKNEADLPSGNFASIRVMMRTSEMHCGFDAGSLGDCVRERLGGGSAHRPRKMRWRTRWELATLEAAPSPTPDADLEPGMVSDHGMGRTSDRLEAGHRAEGGS